MLDGHEFMRRFLPHVVPKGFVRVRRLLDRLARKPNNAEGVNEALRLVI